VAHWDANRLVRFLMFMLCSFSRVCAFAQGLGSITESAVLCAVGAKLRAGRRCKDYASQPLVDATHQRQDPPFAWIRGAHMRGRRNKNGLCRGRTRFLPLNNYQRKPAIQQIYMKPCGLLQNWLCLARVSFEVRGNARQSPQRKHQFRLNAQST
jgi:hypothetical protein